MNKTFRALQSSKSDSGHNLAVVEREIQDLPKGDLLIKVSYSSLNYKDALSASGAPGVTRNYPHTPGIDAVGTVEQTTSSLFKEGDKVIVTGYDLGMNTSGGFSEYISVPASWALLLPRAMSEKESMILGTAGLTAGLSVLALEKYTGVKGTNSIVTGSTGGVGSISLALLSKLGSKVTAVSGKAEKKEFLKSIGAYEVLSREELSEKCKLPIGKSIWDIGVDVVSGEILSLLLTSLTPGGAIACSGLVGGPSFKSSIFPFILRGNALIGIDSVEINLKEKEEIWNLLSEDWKVDTSGFIKEVELENLPEEIDNILKGTIVGRVLLKL
tara:strand:+ start:8185 stop:9168 length:984 start_codon:yes stop_codon:yes gene_type:complete